jgi:hypothetical protein
VPLTKSLLARWTCDALVRGCFGQNARAAIIARKSEAPAKRSLHLPTQTQSSTLPSPHHRGLVVSASLAMDHHDSVDGFGVILAHTFRQKDLTEIRFSAEERACEEIERLHKNAKSCRAHRV